MPVSDTLTYEPVVRYQSAWLIAGCALLVGVVAWYVVVFFVTRRKRIRTINTLMPVQVVPIDMDSLRQKYLQLIAQVESQYAAKSMTSRQVHQELSSLVRLFVFEARGVRAQVLTLNDLKQSDLTALTELIELYYPGEFASIERSEPDSAVQLAKEMVQSWR